MTDGYVKTRLIVDHLDNEVSVTFIQGRVSVACRFPGDNFDPEDEVNMTYLVGRLPDLIEAANLELEVLAMAEESNGE